MKLKFNTYDKNYGLTQNFCEDTGVQGTGDLCLSGH